jgi:toxin ParE1/3/4
VKPVVIQAEAKWELAEGIAWYESQSPGVGLRLQAEVELAVGRLQRNPDWYPPYKQSGFRMKTVRRFPYAVFYVELPDCIWVAAIANLNRKPDYWKSRRIENG